VYLAWPERFHRRVIVFGAVLVNPAVGDLSKPTITAVTANVNGDLARYSSSVRLQIKRSNRDEVSGLILLKSPIHPFMRSLLSKHLSYLTATLHCFHTVNILLFTV